MSSLVNDFAAGLFTAPEPPCLSLYQPTHRHHPANQQDPIRFRNLVKAMEESLRQKYPARDVPALLEPFHALAQNERFWNHTLDGLAVLHAPTIFRVYTLQRPVSELAIVADSFHVKPLLRILQSADRYHVLGLNRQGIRLFEGNRDALDEVELSAEVSDAIAEATREDDTRPAPAVWTHGSDSAKAGIYHGVGSDDDLVDRQTERLFRAIDRTLLEHYSRPSGLPLLLAALPEHLGLFHRVSHNPFLMPDGIDAHPDTMDVEALRGRAWRAVEPYYLARLAGLIEMFGSAQSKGLGTADLAQAADSALAGRVATLLVEADRHVPGRIDPETGEIQLHDGAQVEVDDLLDDIAEAVLRNRGQVVIVPAERMPTSTGIAAIYRF
jgi:hypothetical protein